MKIRKTIEKINIGQVGTMSLDIFVHKFKGSKKGPKALILNGIHGDEFTGLLVADRLLNKLKDFKGELWLITSANPLATAMQKRTNPTDNIDLNRVFPGNAEKGLTSRIANKIFEIASQTSFVIDFHTFPDPTVLTGIFMNVGNKKIDKEMMKQLTAFDPDVVWRLNIKTEQERKYATALGPRLALSGIPNIAIELPQAWQASEEQINRAVEGTIRVLNNLGITDIPTKKGSTELTVNDFFEVHSDSSGIFIPTVELLQKVKKGQTVGQLLNIKTMRKTNIKSPKSGQLVVLKNNQLVMTGDRLFSIGVKTK